MVVSHKALIEADIEEQKKEIIGQLEKGQVLEGVVKNVTSYGVFVDLGGVDGLIHYASATHEHAFEYSVAASHGCVVPENKG